MADLAAHIPSFERLMGPEPQDWLLRLWWWWRGKRRVERLCRVVEQGCDTISQAIEKRDWEAHCWGANDQLLPSDSMRELQAAQMAQYQPSLGQQRWLTYQQQGQFSAYQRTGLSLWQQLTGIP